MEQKTWGFEKRVLEKKKEKDIVPYILYVFLMFFSFCSFSVFVNIKNVAFADTNDSTKYLVDYDIAELDRQGISPAVARVFNDYKNGENIFQKDSIQIDYILSNTDKFQQLLSFVGYGEEMDSIRAIINKYIMYKYDVYKLLGSEEKKTYLIMLENVSERRADGGFIGSFMKVSFEGGHMVDMKVFDAYYPLWEYCKNQEGTDMEAIHDTDKWWSSCKNKFLLSSRVDEEPYSEHWYSTTFINSNIYGFTDLNGESVIKLYNKIYNDKIDGVIFVKSSILEKLLNDGRKVYWEMEFMNYLSGLDGEVDKDASSDEIKGLKGKKKDYLLSLDDILKNRKKEVLLNFIRNYESIFEEGMVRAYLPDIDSNFANALEKENLVFLRDKSKLYLFDYNVGSNKSSKFVTNIVDINGFIYDKTYPLSLNEGFNSINVKYEVNMTDEYKEFLENMQVKYDVELPEYSYLLDEKYDYKLIPILPENCELLNLKDTYLEINCE